MTKYNEAGKGSKQRPTDKSLFDDNYDRIFGIWCKHCRYKQQKTESQPVLCESCGKEL